jgi:hypothetical protein
LTELDTEEGEGHKEEEITGEVEEEGDDEEEIVSSQDMEHSVILVASRR